MERAEAIKIIDCYDIGFYDLSGEKIPADKLADAFDMAIEALSTDRPMGEWIKRGTKITCSHCKSAWSASFDTIIVGMKYCPYCGADMRGGDNE